jgi:hypothetical protein
MQVGRFASLCASALLPLLAAHAAGATTTCMASAKRPDGAVMALSRVMSDEGTVQLHVAFWSPPGEQPSTPLTLLVTYPVQHNALGRSERRGGRVPCCGLAKSGRVFDLARRQDLACAVASRAAGAPGRNSRYGRYGRQRRTVQSGPRGGDFARANGAGCADVVDGLASCEADLRCFRLEQPGGALQAGAQRAPNMPGAPTPLIIRRTAADRPAWEAVRGPRA